MRTLAALLLLAALVLAVLNPDRAAFQTFAEAQSERLLRQETGASVLGRALAGAGARLAGSYVGRRAERQNYLLFSTYTVDLDGPEQEAGDWRFLGIAGCFVELHRPEQLRPR